MKRLLAILALVLLVAAPAAAACPKTTVGDVENEVMCPVCGTPLGLATEAPQAQRERELIRRLVDRCRSKEQVKAVLVAEFGEKVLAVPDDEGFDLAAYLVPALVILLAGGALGVSAWRWRGTRAAEAAVPAGAGADLSAAEPPPAAARRLESDLDRYEL